MKKNTNNYIDNKKFYDAMVIYKAEVEEYKRQQAEYGVPNIEKPRVTSYIGECLLLIAKNLGKAGNFSSYTYIGDMQSDAIENCFHGDTKVLTIEYGPIELSKIVGLTVTVKARDGIWRRATIENFGKQMLYEVGFGSSNKQIDNINQKVLVTENHRWFTQSRLDRKKLFVWKNETVTDLRIGDMLETVPFLDGMDKNAIVHGLIFGDGSVYKKTVYGNNGAIVRQGNDWAFMRVCKQDLLKNEICDLLDSLGYRKSYLKSANGDPIYYFGKFPFCKELPFSNDPSYIAGFIYGWWLADGNKTMRNNEITIGTIHKDAADWLIENAAYAGYHLISHRITTSNERSTGFKSDNDFHIITLRHDEFQKPRVKYIKEYGIDDVYCVIEPVTNGFVLANGLLTGNCLKYIDNFDPERKNPFAYFTTIMYYAFIRRIAIEKKEQYVKYKNLENFLLSDQIAGVSSIDMTSIDNDMTNQIIRNYEEYMQKKKNPEKGGKKPT